MSWFLPSVVSIPDLIELHGTWRKNDIAFVEETRRLSWEQFSRQTAQVANGLRTAGVRHGGRVGILMGNSLEFIVAMFGIIRSGCVAVPINVSVSDSAVLGMMEDAAVDAIFASDVHCTRIEALASESARIRKALKLAHGYTLAGWLDFNNWRQAQSANLFDVAIQPDDECNIIYSSGTTGLPKGIVHSHQCRLNWAAEMAIALRYRSDAVTICSLGLYSNISWVSFLAAMFVGATVVIMRAFDAVATLDVMKREKVTHGSFVPLQLERMLSVPDLESHRPDSLETLMVCGSGIRLEVKKNCPKMFNCDLIELYGLTEGVYTILSVKDFERRTASVGKPVLFGNIKIVDENDREVGTGVLGEIVGFSSLLMSGYHNRVEANHEVTWVDAQGRRWLRTGDMGFLDEEGFLFIVDRKKDMILSGSQNIYPADIERVMRQHPDIADVAVIGLRSEKWGETPVAIAVPKSGCLPDREAVKTWTNARVGKQQRIADIIWRETLPRNPGGKILKRELKAEFATCEY